MKYMMDSHILQFYCSYETKSPPCDDPLQLQSRNCYNNRLNHALQRSSSVIISWFDSSPSSQVQMRANFFWSGNISGNCWRKKNSTLNIESTFTQKFKKESVDYLSYIVLPPNSRPPNSLSLLIHGFLSISKTLLIHQFIR